MVQSVRASGRRLLLLVLKDEHRDDDDDDDNDDEIRMELGFTSSARFRKSVVLRGEREHSLGFSWWRRTV